MNLAMAAFERAPLPDAVSRAVIASRVARTDARLRGVPGGEAAAFAASMAGRPIAEHTDLANAQHYEVPAAFFAAMLGPQRKYSCCFYPDASTTLAEAEEAALVISAIRAGLKDGQRVLELGCGWGSFSLWMARHYPGSEIVAVSNSASQRAAIEARAQEMGVQNLQVVTADMNDFIPDGQFDRIVSIEMFEHMANWRMLLGRARGWLRPEGRLFVHVFTHETAPYRFENGNGKDWIGQHFFSGGIMPSHALFSAFPDLFHVEQAWRWSGRHYERTALDWLRDYDANRAVIEPILRDVYGPDADLWRRRWRLFLLATAGLFGHRGGRAWGVSHYLLAPV